MLELTRAQGRRMRLIAQGLGGAGRAGADPGPARAAPGPEVAGPSPATRHASVTGGLSPAGVVRHMVAMQGQDLAQVLRAIAVRCAPGTTLADVRAAFDRGELVRSWAQRGTLFVATPEDMAALHATVAPRMRPQEWRMCTDRGIDERTAQRSASVLVEQLQEGPASRPAMLAAWEAAGVETGGGRGYHLLALHAYDGLVRFGPFDGEAQLLLGGASPAVAEPAAALAEMLRRFVAARGPLTVADAAWWSGLPKTVVRASLALVQDLAPVLVDGEPMLVASDAASGRRTGMRLVPGFDEWILGYGNRSHTASPAMLQAMVPGNNGVFKPVVLVDGRAVGTWRWPPQRGSRPVEPMLQMVEGVPEAALAGIHRALASWPHR